VRYYLDHVIVHVRALAGATADWRALGLEPTDGGQHPRVGTRNAIVRFPDRSFLELLAIEDRERVREAAPATLAFAELHPDGPISWALRVDDLRTSRTELQRAGFRVGEIRMGEGRRDSGKTARWRSFAVEEPAFPFLIEYAEPPTSSPSVDGLPIAGIAAAIVQGVSAGALAARLAAAFGTLREDGRVPLASGEVAVVEVPEEHPGVIGAELLVTDEARAGAILAERRVGVVDGWVRDPRLHGLALRLVAERRARA
jgi:hypothetical protein